MHSPCPKHYLWIHHGTKKAQNTALDISFLWPEEHLRPVSIALLFGKDFQIVKEAGEARLQAELQVVLFDHQHQHGHKQGQEAKGETHWALTTLLRAEVVAHQSVEGLSEGEELNEKKQECSPRILPYLTKTVWELGTDSGQYQYHL